MKEKGLRGICLFLVLAISFGGTSARAETVLLKSGARGEMTVGLSAAPERSGGAGAGNLLLITVALASLEGLRREMEGRSLCQRYARDIYGRLVADVGQLPPEISGLVDPTAPLAAVRVAFRQAGTDGVSVNVYQDFDMRGIVPCRPA
ncbi:hypothetical protein [Pseudoruegeria sp. HB172150]|uniref:hypothetical protein n=1 Tax=Pseudoruegeria sp. HB172150 TaxID=2721164 RepID=UPI00155810E9|nr:hypothetical protein [Pseudoruegeria sp. HB172150]